MGWVVNATPRPLYPRERPGIRCIGGWVGPRVGLDGCGKCRPHRPARSESRYRLSYPGPHSSWRSLIILGDKGDRSVLKVRNNSASDARQILINTNVRISHIARQNQSPGRGRTELSFTIKVCLTIHFCVLRGSYQADITSERRISLQSIK